MSLPKKIIILIACCTTLTLNAQTIFQEDFNTETSFSSWNLSAKVEYALWLGKANSKYLRFHPNYQNQFIETPGINLPAANYTFSFDWNQARQQNTDSVNLQLSIDNGTTWQTMYAIYNGNNRTWQTDSFVFNSVGGSIKFRWNYFSTGNFPSQYFNLDNILIKKNTTTGIRNNSTDITTELFPNPNNGNFQLKIYNAKNQKGNILIYNMQGELIYQQNLPVVTQSLVQIDLSILSKGSYLLNIEANENNYSKTLIIQ
jgi:hypothetical protein